MARLTGQQPDMALIGTNNINKLIGPEKAFGHDKTDRSHLFLECVKR